MHRPLLISGQSYGSYYTSVSLPNIPKSTRDTLTFYKVSYALLMLKTCFSIFIKIY